MITSCNACGKEINRSPCLIKEINFCNKSCRGAFERKSPNTTCVLCGKPFRVKPCELRRGHDTYCHNPCYGRKPKNKKDLDSANSGKTRLSVSAIKKILRLCNSGNKKAEMLNDSERAMFVGFMMPHRKHIFPIWRNCSVCDKIFMIKNKNMLRSTQCSSGCSKRKPIEEKCVTQTVCGFCGKPIVIDNHKVLEHNFCSTSCVTSYRWANGLIEVPSGEECYNWKGGVTYNKPANRYSATKMVRCPIEFIEMARISGYVLESRLVMAQFIGRPLAREEVVHHIDSDPLNNSIDNLRLFANQSEHILAEHGKGKNK